MNPDEARDLLALGLGGFSVVMGLAFVLRPQLIRPSSPFSGSNRRWFIASHVVIGVTVMWGGGLDLWSLPILPTFLLILASLGCALKLLVSVLASTR